MRTIFISATVTGIWLKCIYYQLMSNLPIQYSLPRGHGNEEAATHDDESAIVKLSTVDADRASRAK